MKKKKLFNLLMLILIISHEFCFAPNAIPAATPMDPVEFAFYVGQAVMVVVFFGYVGLDGYDKYKKSGTGQTIRKSNSMLEKNKYSQEKILHYMCQAKHTDVVDLLAYNSPSWIKDFPEKEVVFKETSSTDGLPAERE